MGGGVTFYKQFNKVFNLSNISNYINQKLFKYQVNNILAFSLIELSIVLIIIGLLVAGVTGGASLIESAKIRALSNEINSYKQAYFAFKALNDRAPGDLNNSGMIGLYSGQTYNSNSFPEPYNSNAKNGIPNEISAPFVDLYLAKIIDFQPKEANLSYNSKENDLARPSSNILNDLQYYFEYGQEDESYYNDSDYYKYRIKPGNKISIYGLNKINLKYVQNYDIKYDDSKYNSGTVRTSCGNNKVSYEDTIKKGANCHITIVAIE